ncbi:acid phosphatase [Trichoderma arundinaceum]|uniref:Acid phosphatase n=1 Tax=Trichoderma arundinaceum TaxID=490622 RepID=A0A395NU55_TRIAR|nr:acid phosphatase [Trichoderma arundinaceum]
MKASVSLAIIIPALAAQGARIVQSNDDGWAELYVRSFNNALNASGHDVVLSAPADDNSGTGSSDEPPTPRKDPCQYNSCPGNGDTIGHNATRPDLNWVNSFPVTAMKYGLSIFGPQLWNGSAPDFAVSGPNVGTNVFVQLPFSGTVNAAAFAAHEAGIPSIAFSAASTGRLPFDTNPVPLRSSLYAQLATQLTNKVISSGKPYLPSDVFLNVNFPKVEGNCTDVSNFKWVLSRVNPGIISPPDVEFCNGNRLPTELSVITHSGCFISVSVGDAKDKTTASSDKQAVVLGKLRDILTCLPS